MIEIKENNTRKDFKSFGGCYSLCKDKAVKFLIKIEGSQNNIKI